MATKQTTPDEAVAGAIGRHYHSEAREQKALAARYLEHLRSDGDPAASPVTGYMRPRLEPQFQRIAFRAWEAECGDEPRPYTPADGRYRYRVAAFMHAHLNEWIPYDTLRRLADGGRLDTHALFGGRFYQLERETPYAIEREKLDGKVHYRMVRRADA
jgi:hypothetical protein